MPHIFLYKDSSYTTCGTNKFDKQQQQQQRKTTFSTSIFSNFFSFFGLFLVYQPPKMFEAKGKKIFFSFFHDFVGFVMLTKGVIGRRVERFQFKI